MAACISAVLRVDAEMPLIVTVIDCPETVEVVGVPSVVITTISSMFSTGVIVVTIGLAISIPPYELTGALNMSAVKLKIPTLTTRLTVIVEPSDLIRTVGISASTS